MENYYWESNTGLIELEGIDFDIEKCNLKYEDLFINIEEAASSITEKNLTFITYDLAISEAENFHIAQTILKSSDKGTETYFNSALHNPAEEIDIFLNRLMPDGMQSTKMVMKNLLTNIISATISASGYEYAEVDIRLHSKTTENFMDLHIDKSHAEMISQCGRDSDDKNFAKQKVFIFPLYGEATYFFDMPDAVRGEFLQYTHETSSTYGQAYSEHQSEILELFEKMNFHTAEAGQASIHYAGTDGTIHSKPFFHEKRLVVLVYPNQKDILLNLDACFVEALNKAAKRT